MSASTLTIKQLYGCSGNQCAEPECENTLVEYDKLTGNWVNYGEIAHIHGQKVSAQRYCEEIAADKDQLHGFDNLLLLCKKHHTQIDQEGAEAVYTHDLIRSWKNNHILKVAAKTDRGWVYGASEIRFQVEGKDVVISYWLAEDGKVQIHSDEQQAQTDAARDLSMIMGQLGSMLDLLEQASGEPSDPSHQTMNDGYIGQLKKMSENLKRSWRKPGHQFESALERIYSNFVQCSDITLAEFAEVGSERRPTKTTLVIGGDPREIAPDVFNAMQTDPDKS